MVRVVWSKRALDDLDFIRAFVEQFDGAAAQRLTRRLISAGESLGDFPRRGRPLGEERRALSTVWPYVIRYNVADAIVQIESVRHGARQPQP